ncbi:HAD family hydrolase [Halorutilales archaeon Cl-col2-1]
MRLIFDYGGTVIDEVDETEYTRMLDVSEGHPVPYPGYIAYKAFSLGLLDTVDEYITVLSRLTGVPEERCREYLDERVAAPTLDSEVRQTLERLSDDHELVLFTDQVKPWIDEALDSFGISDLFEDVVVSSEIAKEKPHPKGYVRAIDGRDDAVMVSDELNDDLLMADYFGATTVWIQNSYEEVVEEPDYRIDDVTEVEEIVEGLE